MKFSIITLFPDMFSGPFGFSIIKRAGEKKLINIEIINLRDFSTDAYKSVDDRPYGGGAGMILRVDIVDRAIQAVSHSPRWSSGEAGQSSAIRQKIILLDPQGTPYKQSIAKDLATNFDHIILICGHYEGVDERVRDLVDEEISIGDYILTGGEIPAMVIVDSVTRLLDGVLSKKEATVHESFSDVLLEYPQYTRPEIYNGIQVPDVLKSGDPKKINTWQKKEALQKTTCKRPDLLKGKKD